MRTYALIVNGAITSLWLDTAPDPLAAGYTDITGQPGTVMVGSTWNGTAWVAPVVPAAVQAAALLAGGITVTSTSTPSLNGTYGCGDDDQANITSIAEYISDYPGTFPTGPTMPWVDLAGVPHVFTTAQFAEFDKAVAQIRTQVKLFGLGAVAAPPSMSVTIP